MPLHLVATVATSLAATASALASAGGSVASSATTAGSGFAAIVETAVPQAVASVLPSAVTTTAPVTAGTIAIPVALEVTATFAGALAGALTGVEHKFDAVGVTALAIVSGMGGGMMRDVLLQKYGIYALQNPRVLIAALLAALLGFFFFSAASRIRPVLFLIDALSLGLFCVSGSDKALLAGLTIVPAILLGTITSVGGGILRDLLSDRVPQVMRPGGFYATASVTGATVYVLLVSWLNIVKPVAMILVVVLVLGLRLLSQWLGWSSPVPVDLTHKVAAVPRRIVLGGGRAIGGMRRLFKPRAEPTIGSPDAAEGQAAENQNVDPGVDPPPQTRGPADGNGEHSS